MTPQERKVMEMALEALEYHTAQTRPIHQTSEAITAIKEVLAQPEQYPQIAINPEIVGYVAPQRTWVKLTDEEIWKFWWARPEISEGKNDSMEAEFVAAVRAVLAAHGIKE